MESSPGALGARGLISSALILLVANPGLPGMGAATAVVVLGAAVAHAFWNALAKQSPDQHVTFLWLNLAVGALGLAGILAFGLPARAAIPFLLASVTVHLAYNLSLLNSYRFGDLSQVYPLARGVAPVLVAIGAIAFAGETLSPPQLAAVAVTGVGLAGLAELRRLGDSRNRAAVMLAGATGLAIACYSLLDGLGVRRSGSPLAYAALLFTLEGLLVAPAIALPQLRAGRPLTGSGTVQGALAGAISWGAYAAVLWAQQRAPLAMVSALRETSVLVAVAIGRLFLGEKLGTKRLIAGFTVGIGVIALLATGVHAR